MPDNTTQVMTGAVCQDCGYEIPGEPTQEPRCCVECDTTYDDKGTRWRWLACNRTAHDEGTDPNA